MKIKFKRKPRKAAVRSPRPSHALRGKLVRIGNSRGIRLPKAVIEQAGLKNDVEIAVRDGQVIIQSTDHPRAGWEEQIKKALVEYGDDIEDWRDWQNMSNEFDEKEWTW